MLISNANSSQNTRLGNIGRLILTNFTSMVSERIVSLVSSFVITFLLTRYLGAAGYGEYSLAISQALIFLPIASWGIDQICLRDLARHPEQIETILGRTFSLKLLLASIAWLLAILAAFFLHYPAHIILGTGVFGLTLLISPLEIGALVFQAKLKYEYIAGGSAVASLIQVSAVIAGVYKGFGVVAFLIIAFFTTSLRSIVLWLLVFRRIRYRPSWNGQYAIYILRESTPLALVGILTTINMRLDVILLSNIKSPTAAALYSAPFAIFYALTFLTQGIASTFFPLFSDSYRRDNEQLSKLFKIATLYVWTISLPLFIGGFMVANKLVPFLFGKDFVDAIHVFQILCIAQLVSALAPLLGVMLLVVGAQREGLRISFYITMVGVVLNIILITQFSQIGAAFTSLLVSLAIVTMSIIILKRFIEVAFPLQQLWRIALPTLLMAGVVVICSPFSVMLQISIGALCYLTALAFCTNRYRLFVLQNDFLERGKVPLSRDKFAEIAGGAQRITILNATEARTQNFKRELTRRGWQINEFTCYSWWVAVKNIFKFRKALSSSQFVLAGTGFPYQCPWLMMAFLMGRKVLFDCPMDITIAPFIEAAHWEKMVSYFFRRADGFITIASRKYLIDKFKLSPRRALFLESCPDLERMTAGPLGRTRFEFSKSSLKLCYSGVAPWQEIDLFIPVYKELLAQVPDAELLVISQLDEPMIGRLKEKAEELGILANIKFLPIVTPYEDFLATVMECDVWVAHMGENSVQGQHEIRMELLEMGVIGKPVISVPTVALESQGFVDGTNIIFIDPKNPKRSAQHIVNCIRSKDDMTRLGNNLRDHVLQKFSLVTSIDRMLTFVGEIDQSILYDKEQTQSPC